MIRRNVVEHTQGVKALQHRRLVKRQTRGTQATDETNASTTAAGAATTTSTTATPVHNTPTETTVKETPTSTATSSTPGLIILGPPHATSSTPSITSTSVPLQPTTSASVGAPNPSALTSSVINSALPTTTGLGASNPSLSSTQTSSAASDTSTSSSSDGNNAGPIVGGVVGGLFALVALSLFVAFLVRRWRRREIDKAIFDATEFRRSAVNIDDQPAASQPKQRSLRPPTMIERHMANASPGPMQQQQYQRSFGNVDQSTMWHHQNHNHPNYRHHQHMSVQSIQFAGGGNGNGGGNTQFGSGPGYGGSAGTPQGGGYGQQGYYTPHQGVQMGYYSQQGAPPPPPPSSPNPGYGYPQHPQQMYGYGQQQMIARTGTPVHRSVGSQGLPSAYGMGNMGMGGVGMGVAPGSGPGMHDGQLPPPPSPPGMQEGFTRSASPGPGPGPGPLVSQEVMGGTRAGGEEPPANEHMRDLKVDLVDAQTASVGLFEDIKALEELVAGVTFPDDAEEVDATLQTPENNSTTAVPGTLHPTSS
ncbi:hypothetical protein AMATHDRAFT_47462 [Amanita thiersii Skay4041]|uniref:Uncharacterized protein n=1 Tax=Amanita thiersii Skay4041 TaxID=703135 RepID=A0A2A9NTC9_9AGAR|nr:hypothetical protein AMATHDRAFT_47462 [Amanita thiersii Skay4041]